MQRVRIHLFDRAKITYPSAALRFRSFFVAPAFLNKFRAYLPSPV